MATYLVTLATGQQGRYTIKHLLASGALVHAVVRDPLSAAARKLESEGFGKVTLFKGDLTDIAAYGTAAQGCSGIFLNLPDPDHSNTNSDYPYQIAADILRVCHEAGVQTVVASTAMFTGSKEAWDNAATERIGLRGYFLAKSHMERATRTANLPNWTILRPGWLHSNYLFPASRAVYPELASTGELAHALNPGRTMVHVDEEDVGRYAAAALRDPVKFRGEVIDLGNENLTMEDIARNITSVSGREVGARRRTAEEFQHLTTGSELPLSLPFELWANLVEFRTDRAPDAEKFGITLTSFETYLRKRAPELLASLPQK